jgi:hypothetical protein
MVNQQYLENATSVRQPAKDFVVECIARGEMVRSPAQKLPSTAIYCHFGAAIPLRPFQPFHFVLAPRGRAGQPGPQIGRLAKRAIWAVDGIVESGENAASESVRSSALRAVMSDFIAVSNFAGLEGRVAELHERLRPFKGWHLNVH